LAKLKEALEQAKESYDNDPVRIAYARLFTTPDGKVVLKNLREQFYDCIITSNTEISTVAKAAQHDVVAVILKMIGDEK